MRFGLIPNLPSRKIFFSTLIVAIAWASLPWVAAELMAPSGSAAVGTSALNPGDVTVYASYIEQGRTGSWWMDDWFTSETYEATIWQPLWWGVGRAAEFLGISNSTAYLLTRLVGAAVFVWTLSWALAWALPKRRHQTWALWLTLFGGGLGWAWALMAPSQPLVMSAPDFWVAEMYPVLSMLTGSHFLWVTSGFVITLVAVERWAAERQTKWLAAAAVVGVLTLAIHPFHLITWTGIWLAGTCWRALRREPIRRYVFGWLTVWFAAAPVLLLYGLQIGFDPLAFGRADQNTAATWDWPLTIVALGGWLVAAWGSRAHQWDNPAARRWLISWAVIGVVVIFLPVSFQRRLSQGLIIPFIWLSTPVLIGWFEKISPIVLRRTAIVGTVFVVVLSGAMALGLTVHGYWQEIRGQNSYNFFLSPEQQDFLQTLRRDPEVNHVVLASITTSQLVAAHGRHRVFIGHSVETLDFQQKLNDLKWFYGQATPAEQVAWLEAEHICWIINGPRERAYGQAFSPDTWPALLPARSGPTTQLYYYQPCG